MSYICIHYIRYSCYMCIYIYIYIHIHMFIHIHIGARELLERAERAAPGPKAPQGPHGLGQRLAPG